MKKNAYNIKRGQAAVELAIFGSIILVAFSVLLMYGQRLDSQQQVKMEAFRKALQKAYERNGSVSYTLKKESRAANLFGGFGQGQPSTAVSSASVLWQKGLPGSQADAESFWADVPVIGFVWSIFKPSGADRQKEGSYTYYAINDKEIELDKYPKQQINLIGKKQTVWAPVGVYNEEQIRTEEYNTTVKKEEASGGINNTKTSDLKDTIETDLHVRFDRAESDARALHSSPLPVYVYEGNPYDDIDMGEQKVEAIPESISLGAYARDDINRIDYSKDKVGTDGKSNTTIHREREWQTEN